MVVVWTLHHNNWTGSMIHYMVANTAHYSPERRGKKNIVRYSVKSEISLINKNAMHDIQMLIFGR
jgi:hypothetical protein